MRSQDCEGSAAELGVCKPCAAATSKPALRVEIAKWAYRISTPLAKDLLTQHTQLREPGAPATPGLVKWRAGPCEPARRALRRALCIGALGLEPARRAL